MPVVALKDMLDPAFEERYGVAAINVVNDLTLGRCSPRPPSSTRR